MAKKTIAKKTTAKKPSVKRPSAKKATAKKPAARTAVRKTISKKAAVKKTEVKKTTGKKPAPKKEAAKKSAVKNTVKKPALNKKEKKTASPKPSAKKTKTIKTAAKKPAVKKTAAKKPAAKKTAARKPAVKKPAVKKTTLKKSTVKKTTGWVSAEDYCGDVKIKRIAKTSNEPAVMLTNEELAELYWQQLKHEDLFELCKKVLQKEETKKSPVWLERQSNCCCYLGKWKETIKVSKKRTSLFPKDRDAWDVLAISHAVLGDYNSAAGVLKEAEEKMNWDISCDETAVNEKPSVKAEFNNCGKEGSPSSFSGDNWRKYAMYTVYPKILNDAPQCAAGWYVLAKFYGDDLHYYSDAAKAIEKAVALKPEWKLALAYQKKILSFLV